MSLVVDEVTLSRGDRRVLDHVTFRVTGRVVSLLGPSGIGKTSLLRVLAGLEHAESGHVEMASGVGLVFQHYPLLEHRTIEENLVVAGRIGGLDAAHALSRTRELLARVGLADHADRYPAELSGGQRQRAAVAQQLVLPRRVLLLDEPFSGLDPVRLADVCTLVRDVAKAHELETVVIVTHDIRAALRVSDTIVLLGKGEHGAKVHVVYDTPRESLAPEIEQRFREL